MTSKQNAQEYAIRQVELGHITPIQANVLMIQMEGVRLIRGPIPRDVRAALNQAVKAGEMGHIKKEGLRPEAYHHKNGRARALEERDKVFLQAIEAMKNVFA